MTTDMTVFTPLLMAALGMPVTPGRTEWCARWAAGEGTGAHFNPFATTMPGLEDPTDPYWNSFGPNGQYHVRNYKDMPSGVAQTAATIKQANFALILQSLNYQRVIAGVDTVMRSTWGTVALADQIVAGFTPTGWTSDYVSTGPPPPPVPALTDAQTAAVKGLIDGSFGPIFLQLFRQMVGLDPSTYGSAFAASVAEVQVALKGQTTTQVYADIGRILTQAGAATTAAGNARG